MKFEYGDDTDRGECVAMIVDNDGSDLLLKCDEGWLCLYNKGDSPNIWEKHDLSIGGVVKKFYKGDKITITF